MVDVGGDDPVRDRRRRRVLALEDPLNQTDAVSQKAFKLVLEVRTLVRVLRALAVHLQPVVEVGT